MCDSLKNAYVDPGPQGKASPTSLAAAVADAVKTTCHSAGSAFSQASTWARTASMAASDRADDGLAECGLPYTAAFSSAATASTWDCVYKPAPV